MSDNTAPDDELDAALLGQVRDAVLAAEQPPTRLRDAAIRALTWDADMETLLATFDSAEQPAAMRSATTARDLTYDSGGVTIEISIAVEDQDGTVLSGSVAADTDRVILTQPGRPDQAIEVDEHGRFRMPVTGSLAGVVVTTTDGRRVRTELFSLDPTTPGP